MKPTWDASLWLEEKQNLPHGIYYARLPRVRAWENTLEIIKADGYIAPNGTEVTIDDSAMMKGNTVYSEAIDVSFSPVVGETRTWVENMDCLFLGKKLLDMGFTPAVLNFSSQLKACGDINRGVKGQEQDILRRTNLTKAHSQIYSPEWSELLGVENRGNVYPLDAHFGCVYTPDVTVFRMSDFFSFALLDEPFRLAVISCGAEACGDDAESELIDRIRTIFRVGLANGHDALVLGGWGCGADGNAPGYVAGLFKKVMEEPELKNRYRAVVFACAAKPTRKSPYGKFAPFADLFGTEVAI